MVPGCFPSAGDVEPRGFASDRIGRSHHRSLSSSIFISLYQRNLAILRLCDSANVFGRRSRAWHVFDKGSTECQLQLSFGSHRLAPPKALSCESEVELQSQIQAAGCRAAATQRSRVSWQRVSNRFIDSTLPRNERKGKASPRDRPTGNLKRMGVNSMGLVRTWTLYGVTRPRPASSSSLLAYLRFFIISCFMGLQKPLRGGGQQAGGTALCECFDTFDTFDSTHLRSAQLPLSSPSPDNPKLGHQEQGIPKIVAWLRHGPRWAAQAVQSVPVPFAQARIRDAGRAGKWEDKFENGTKPFPSLPPSLPPRGRGCKTSSSLRAGLRQRETYFHLCSP
ncbi:hypothetical protein B0H67DRAFT_139855 [Lasiosphaeris hirsuta]|uniref:Uncharacterized protein n=1 Tax=Lasiosphaeris hirsuta TaxID=260670 RepID=A0AA40B147_9PEZI|nr:hypothetical protein B0H67DRAFT_139855 [Lasiosphaeris hirsuta]